MCLKPFAFALLLACASLLGRPASAPLPEDDVVLIGSFEALCAFSEGVAQGELTGARARLTADICVSKPFRPIGTHRHMFSGEFDGQGHVISGLIAMGPRGSQGLFGWVAPEGVVKGVTLRRACVQGAGYAGGIAGYCAGRIEDCRVEDSRVINLSRALYGVSAGGVAGTASGRISRCAVLNSSVRGPANAGGLCGAFHAGILERSAFSGTVAGTGAIEAPVGGLAGSLHGGARLRFCLGRGAVLSFLNEYAGSVAGGVFSGSSATGCLFAGPKALGVALLIDAMTGGDGSISVNFQHFFS